MGKDPYRQGDVLLVPVGGVPVGYAAMFDGSTILAYGEESGHAHRFADGSGVCGFYKEGAEDHTIGGGSKLVGAATPIAFVKVPQGGATLVHTSDKPVKADDVLHDPIPVEEGTYRVVRQREYVAPGLEQQVVD